MGDKEVHEKGVSNNSTYRTVSNALDKIPGFKDSATRAKIHEIYHNHVGDKKKAAGNMEGARAEYNRAKEQRERAHNKSPRTYSP